MWMACYTGAEIAKVEDLTEEATRQITQKSASLPELGKSELAAAEHATDFDQPIYNIWKQQTKTPGSSHFSLCAPLAAFRLFRLITTLPCQDPSPCVSLSLWRRPSRTPSPASPLALSLRNKSRCVLRNSLRSCHVVLLSWRKRCAVLPHWLLSDICRRFRSQAQKWLSSGIALPRLLPDFPRCVPRPPRQCVRGADA
jgi:hypothetical protein